MSGARARRVVLTAELVGIIVGAEMVVLGFSGMVAAAPSGTMVTLSFPTGNGTRAVEFTPPPYWGYRVLYLAAPQLHCEPPEWCAAQVTVRSCSDLLCSGGGQLVGTYTVDADGTFTGPVNATIFSISLGPFEGSSGTATMLEVATHWDGQTESQSNWGIPTGGTEWGLVFGTVGVVGVATLLVSWAFWRYAEPRAPTR